MVVLHLRLGCIVAKADDGLAAVVAVALRSVNSASYCPTTGLADYNAVGNFFNHFMICFLNGKWVLQMFLGSQTLNVSKLHVLLSYCPTTGVADYNAVANYYNY